MRGMRGISILGVVAFAMLLATATSRSQSTEPPADGSPVTDPPPEAITGSPSTPFAGAQAVDKKDPFQPYSIGDPAAAWPYESLDSDEKQVVDHGAAEDFSATNDAYAAASKAQGDRARAEAAATSLGADNLDTTGVVP